MLVFVNHIYAFLWNFSISIIYLVFLEEEYILRTKYYTILENATVMKMSKYITPKVNLDELLFVSEEESDIKCGKCNKSMFFTIFYKDKESLDFLVCKDCKIYMQRIIVED